MRGFFRGDCCGVLFVLLHQVYQLLELCPHVLVDGHRLFLCVRNFGSHDGYLRY